MVTAIFICFKPLTSAEARATILVQQVKRKPEMTDCISIPFSAQASMFAGSLSNLRFHVPECRFGSAGRDSEGEIPLAGRTRVGASDLHWGDAAEVLPALDAQSVRLVVTSPPYNIGKTYETRTPLSQYVAFQERIIRECHRALRPDGAMCWQVGNYVHAGEVIPIDSIVIPIFRDLGMKIRNRIVWTFGHGLHCRNRLSGRHETIVWATKSDDYQFDLDAIRVPQSTLKKALQGTEEG